MSLLVTGATGTVGAAVLAALAEQPPSTPVLAAVRDPTAANEHIGPAVATRAFDFEDSTTWPAALAGVTTLFLLRPPQLADVAGTFAPLIKMAATNGVRHIVFLSVQGADKNAVIPHRRIEKLLLASGLAWTFLRPSYFMQNLTTTLRADLLERHRICLPAGRAQFRWVDARDIGRVAATVLRDPPAHAGRAYDITGDELLDFGTVAALITRQTSVDVRYESPNPVRFVWQQQRAGQALAYALVLVMLHWLPRFFAPPPAADTVRRLTGRPPGTLAEFIDREVAPLLTGAGLQASGHRNPTT